MIYSSSFKKITMNIFNAIPQYSCQFIKEMFKILTKLISEISLFKVKILSTINVVFDRTCKFTYRVIVSIHDNNRYKFNMGTCQ